MELDYVIDANILMSMLISGKSSYKKLVEDFRFVSPDYIFTEIEIHHPVILQKSKL
jgi:predicted nucleic acid-binding protein